MDLRYCTRCVISNRRPVASQEYKRAPGSQPGFMRFTDGVCAACRYAELKESIDWKERREQLEALLARYRRTDGRPDVVTGGSGGKDSFYASCLLRDEFGMHPVTVTWRPMIYTDVGRQNFDAWLENGFTNYLVTPNPKIHARLTRFAFLNLGHPFQAFAMGQRSLPTRFAAQHGIDLVVYGEPDEEYEGETGWQEEREVHEAQEELRIGGVTWSDLILQDFPRHELSHYLPVRPDEAAKVQSIALGRYIRWRPQEAYYFAAARGFKANDQRTDGSFTTYSSIDDAMDVLHYYLQVIKFGLGRASHDASHEIRNHNLTREEGVALVRKYDTELPKRYLQRCLDYMGVSIEEFHDTVDRFRPEDLWVLDGGGWHLRSQVE